LRFFRSPTFSAARSRHGGERHAGGSGCSPGGLIVKVAEGCGPRFWRGPGGRCHPFAVGRACPVGYHLGPEGKRCWPNA